MASFEQRKNAVRVVVRVGGAKKTATFDTMREAQAWAKTMERKKALGELAVASGLTVAEALEAYLDAVASKTDGAKWNTLRLHTIAKDPIGSMPIAKVIAHDVNEWITRRSATVSVQTGKTLSNATVNRELNLLSAAFTYAVKTRKWIKENPCHGAARLAVGRGRDRKLLTEAEMRAICRATGYEPDANLTTINGRVGACFLLALETGMRSGEILRLRPEDYSKEDRTIFVSATEKGGIRHWATPLC